MPDLPDDVHELEDLLRATEDLLREWQKARRTIEDEVRKLNIWLHEPRRFDDRKRGIGTFFSNDSSITLEDLDRARELSEPVYLYRQGEVDARLKPFLDWPALEKIGYELETFRQSAAQNCLRRGGIVADDACMIAEPMEGMVKQLRDLIVAKRKVLIESSNQRSNAKVDDGSSIDQGGANSVDGKNEEYEWLELEILNALDETALKVDSLAAKVTGGDNSRFYRKGWRGDATHHVLSYMKFRGWIELNRSKGGYFRPDRPPTVGKPKNPPKKKADN